MHTCKPAIDSISKRDTGCCTCCCQWKGYSSFDCVDFTCHCHVLEIRIPLRNLPENTFPFTIEFTSIRTAKLVYTITVNDSDAIIIPPIVSIYGPVRIKTTFANGKVCESEAT